MDFEEIMKIFGKTMPDVIPEEYYSMMKEVAPDLNRNNIPWNMVLTTSLFEKLVEQKETNENHLLMEIGEDLNYIEEIYSKTSEVFNFLEPIKVDRIKYKFYTMETSAQSLLEGFQPNKDGFISPPKYNIFNTTTGRMKIVEGANILLLPKKYRNMFQSRFGKDGSLWVLDFVSLEPRVAMCIKNYIFSECIIGHPPLSDLMKLSIEPNQAFPEDIYTFALKKLKLSSDIDRQALKQIILPQLYGQAKSLTIDSLESRNIRRPDEVVEMVNDFFGIEKIKDYVVSQYEKHNCKFIKNFYGRHITPPSGMTHALLNYYIQSTAVDVSLLGFHKIISKISSSKDISDLIKPVYILHDAIILDVHRSIEHVMPKICKLGGTDLPGFINQQFWISAKRGLSEQE